MHPEIKQFRDGLIKSNGKKRQKTDKKTTKNQLDLWDREIDQEDNNPKPSLK